MKYLLSETKSGVKHEPEIQQSKVFSYRWTMKRQPHPKAHSSSVSFGCDVHRSTSLLSCTWLLPSTTGLRFKIPMEAISGDACRCSVQMGKNLLQSSWRKVASL